MLAENISVLPAHVRGGLRAEALGIFRVPAASAVTARVFTYLRSGDHVKMGDEVLFKVRISQGEAPQVKPTTDASEQIQVGSSLPEAGDQLSNTTHREPFDPAKNPITAGIRVAMLHRAELEPEPSRPSKGTQGSRSRRTTPIAETPQKPRKHFDAGRVEPIDEEVDKSLQNPGSSQPLPPPRPHPFKPKRGYVESQHLQGDIELANANEDVPMQDDDALEAHAARGNDDHNDDSGEEEENEENDASANDENAPEDKYPPGSPSMVAQRDIEPQEPQQSAVPEQGHRNNGNPVVAVSPDDYPEPPAASSTKIPANASKSETAAITIHEVLKDIPEAEVATDAETSDEELEPTVDVSNVTKLPEVSPDEVVLSAHDEKKHEPMDEDPKARSKPFEVPPEADHKDDHKIDIPALNTGSHARDAPMADDEQEEVQASELNKKPNSIFGGDPGDGKAVWPFDDEDGDLPLKVEAANKKSRKRKAPQTEAQEETPPSKKHKVGATDPVVRVPRVSETMKATPSPAAPHLSRSSTSRMKSVTVNPSTPSSSKQSTSQSKAAATPSRELHHPLDESANKTFDNMRVAFSISDKADETLIQTFMTGKNLKRVAVDGDGDVTAKNYDMLVIAEGELKATSKTLKSLLFKKIITTYKWVHESQAAGRVLDPNGYLHPDLNLEADRTSLFGGRTIFVTPGLKTAYEKNYKNIEQMAKLAGARIICQSPRKDVEQLVVLGCGPDDEHAMPFMSNGRTVYTKDLFTSSILDGKLNVDDERYKIKQSTGETKKGKGRTKARR